MAFFALNDYLLVKGDITMSGRRRMKAKEAAEKAAAPKPKKAAPKKAAPKKSSRVSRIVKKMTGNEEE